MKNLFRAAILIVVALASTNSFAQFLTKKTQVDFKYPLINAADSNNIAVLSSLLSSGNDPNVETEFGVTALMRAALKGNKEIVSMLLEAKANVNTQDAGGATALHFAARQGHTEIVNMLIKKGAKVSAMDNEGWTPLMRAVTSKKSEIVQALIDAGANVNAKNEAGETALLHASQSGNLKIVQMLMEKGAATNVKNVYGNTPASIAERARNESIKEALTHTPLVPVMPVAPSYEEEEVASASNEPMQEEEVAPPVEKKKAKAKKVKPKAKSAKAIPEADKKDDSKADNKVEPAAEKKIYFLAQFGEFNSEQDAKNFMNTTIAENASQFVNMKTFVAKQTVGEAETFKVRTGLFSDKQAAVTWCTDMRMKNLQCFVVETNKLPQEISPAKEKKPSKKKPEKKKVKKQKKVDEGSAEAQDIPKKKPAGMKKPKKKTTGTIMKIEQDNIEDLPWVIADEKKEKEKGSKGDLTERDTESSSIPTGDYAKVKPATAEQSKKMEEKENYLSKSDEGKADSIKVMKKMEDAAKLPASIAWRERTKSGGSKVEVAEAIRVPVTEQPSLAGSAKEGTIVPDKIFLPSASDSGEGIWLEIGTFTSEQKASEYADNLRERLNRPLRYRTITPLALKGSVSVRIGVLESNEEAEKLCEEARGDDYSCSLVNETTSSSLFGDAGNKEGYNRRRPEATKPYEPANIYMKNRMLFWAHLGSYYSASEAEEKWKLLKSIHKTELGKLDKNIAAPKYGSNAKEIFRLRAGPFGSREQAEKLCEKLTKKFVGCYAVSD